ncbi:hypothetical protein [Aurantiacibacter sediminis]|uniref:Uncharacterized protein n=1 Tax=Aurantiacibacter sediminis TaxID=2793064 RepID=A0ABS0N4F7_9SPHN|nr:hypothetical protein [Aurantiacibacter sediminis]MBH5321899.1 hypothetical protein [Aurantiacibacter sediminis]
MSENHLTDIALDETSRAPEALDPTDTAVPGPSPNPATNILINDVILRSVGRVSRMTVEKAILGKQYGRELAKDAVENRSTINTLAVYAITKVATRSIPGAALVASGLLAKTLFDRSQNRRAAVKQGNRTIRDMAAEDERA